MKTSIAVVAVALVATAGCLLRASRTQFRYYTLTATAERSGTARPLRIGLGPVTLPSYLSSAQLVTRIDPTRVDYADLDRWAAPLAKQFIRTLGDDLGTALGTSGVTLFPWYAGTPLDLTVAVTVLAFETDAAGVARLQATWDVRATGAAAGAYQGRSTITEPAASSGWDAAVAALSRAVGRLAEEIAAAIVRQPELSAGHGTDDQERLGTRRDGLGEERVGRLVGEVLRAREEAHEGPPPLRRAVADRAAEDGMAGLEGVEDRPLRDRTRDVEGHLALDARQLAQVRREDDADHGSVWTSTDSTAGRSRTTGAQVSPASADAYTCPPVVPK
jgi:uncharacterized lipoprotein YmbA